MKKCNKLLLISFFVLGMAMQPTVLCAQKKSDSPIVEVGFDKKKARHTRAMRKSDFSMMYDIMKKNAFENQKMIFFVWLASAASSAVSSVHASCRSIRSIQTDWRL